MNIYNMYGPDLCEVKSPRTKATLQPAPGPVPPGGGGAAGYLSGVTPPTGDYRNLMQDDSTAWSVGQTHLVH